MGIGAELSAMESSLYAATLEDISIGPQKNYLAPKNIKMSGEKRNSLMSLLIQTPASHAELVEVIYVISSRGSGTDLDPVRHVLQYWSKDGRLLAEYDTLSPDTQQQNFPITKNK